MGGAGGDVREPSVVDAAAADFERFARTHGDTLLHAAYGLCGDWQHAEDLVQQALVAVAQRWPTIADNPAGYAYRCMTRANIDRWRRGRGRPETLVATPAPRDHPGSGDAVDAVDDRLTAAVLLQSLPPRQRAIVVLRYLQDLSEADVAAVLGISVGSVKSGAARGLATLRKTATTATTATTRGQR